MGCGSGSSEPGFFLHPSSSLILSPCRFALKLSQGDNLLCNLRLQPWGLENMLRRCGGATLLHLPASILSPLSFLAYPFSLIPSLFSPHLSPLSFLPSFRAPVPRVSTRGPVSRSVFSRHRPFIISAAPSARKTRLKCYQLLINPVKSHLNC